MAGPVPQKVLNWLHSVLINDYRDVNRTYSDIARTLNVHSSLRLKTDVYTFENGISSLLVNVHGALPVNFRGSTYGIPISLWVPHEYPFAAPIGFVTPAQDMSRSNIAELLSLFQDIFAREPPVVAKGSQSQRPPTDSQYTAAPPPVPPLPPEVGRSNHQSPPVQSPSPQRPPPKPPKEGDTASKYDRPAPLPPQKQNFSHNQAQPEASYANGQAIPPHLRSQAGDQRPNHTHFQHPQPLPIRQDSQRSLRELTAPSSPNHAPHPQHRYSQKLPPNTQYQHPTVGQPYNSVHGRQQSYQHPPAQAYGQQASPRAVQPPKPMPVEDLLTSPFDTAMPPQATNIAPPPIPPNPQKDAILSALSSTLTQQIKPIYSSNMSAITPLRAQQAALTSTLNAVNREISQLDDLEAILSSNESILRQAMRDADKVLEDAKRRKVPNVDDVLVAPTVVAGQLYRTVAEEKAIEDCRGVLGKALDKGRIGGTAWAKQSRSLAREEFLKKALIKKISKGMRLAQDTQWQ